jgi:uncharacterized coiled-coil protein SlyX
MTQLPLTILQARAALGASDSTIRRLIKSGVLKVHSHDTRGRILLDPKSVDAVAVAMGRAELAGSEIKREVAPAIATLADVIVALTTTIERQEATIITLAEQLGAARAEARLAPPHAAQADQRAATLEQQLADVRKELTALHEQIRAIRARIPDSDESPA